MHDVQTYLKLLQSALACSAFNGWIGQAGIKAMLGPKL